MPTVTARTGAGVGGSTRVTITFADNAIQNQWLQVTVLANENTDLEEDDVFYFGNVVAETDGNGQIGTSDCAVVADELGRSGGDLAPRS